MTGREFTLLALVFATVPGGAAAGCALDPSCNDVTMNPLHAWLALATAVFIMVAALVLLFTEGNPRR